MEEKVELPIEDITFSEPVNTPFGEVFSEALENFQEPTIIEVPLPIESLETTEPLPIDETSFKEPTIIEVPLPIDETSFQEPVPFEEQLPYENVPTEEAVELYVEVPVDVTPAFECFVQKQASYGLLDGKYLIRY